MALATEAAAPVKIRLATLAPKDTSLHKTLQQMGESWKKSTADQVQLTIYTDGTMGGEGQPQTQAMLFARHVLHRQPLDKALDAPRWLLGRTWGSTHTNLRMESRFDGNLIDRLMSAGHDVDVLSDGYSDTMGHAGAVIMHPNGTFEGAHDPRADGGAAGL